jgi:pimeloyl-ACP methyl ester carboxylesterase
LFSAPGPKRKVVVMAAFPPSSEADLQPFARELAGGGVAALTFQMPVYEGRDFALVDKDIESAVLLLESRDYPQIYVLGDGPASLGVLRLAARRKVAGVVAMLAGPVGSLNVDVPKITAPKLFVAGMDATARTTLAGYMQAAAEPKQSKTFDGPGVGAKLLNGPDGAAVKQVIRDFLLK